MKVGQSVTLELLRHGPAHNQLLSPLTRYIALSGRHESVTVQVPFEQRDFILLLKYLRYDQNAPAMRRAQLKRLGDTMSTIFDGIPGLIGDLCGKIDGAESLTHLRLIFSASELALLPFELTRAPKGYPGEGLSLSMQFDTPIVMTREVRGANGHTLQWDRPPKILFAAAAPRRSVPVNAHLLALRQALDPWIDSYEPGLSLQARLAKHITILPAASLDQIQEACSQQSFTHVHILAHGAESENGKGDRYGLRLFGCPGSAGDEVVDGERLAQALRSHRREIGNGLSQPLVVTVASCDSGQQGSVIWPGASLAQDLHEAGIPLVVASQFPLSKRGSICMVKYLYRSLLWGKDPRVCLHEVRQKLHALNQATHDWASLVAYASLPDDLPAQLQRLRAMQAKKAMDSALSKAYNLTAENDDKDELEPTVNICRKEQNGEVDLPDTKKKFEKAIQALDRAIAWMPESKPDCEQKLKQEIRSTAERIAILGSAAKRLAQAMGVARKKLEEEVGDFSGPERHKACLSITHYRKREAKELDEAVSYYMRAFDVDRSSHWAVVQYLGVRAFVEQLRKGSFSLDMDLWHQARASAERDLAEPDPSRRAWAWGSLVELFFLALQQDVFLTPDIENAFGEPIPYEPAALPQLFAKKLVEESGLQSFEVKATYVQFKRYRDWQRLGDAYVEVAEMVVDVIKGKAE